LSQGIVRQDQRDFDSNPYLLNCQNGIVDLRTGELREHDPGELITKVTAVDYRPGAEHADWTAALEAVPADIREWYQIRLGQGITGDMTPDDLLMVQQGGGANGKSTIMSAVQATVGDYFLTVASRALSASPDTVPTELADFKGVRLASLEELPEEKQLSVTRLKTMVGTPVITARFMRQDTMSFEATHSLIISTNYPPAVAETDAGTWRRLALVHFPFHYVKHAWEIRTDTDRQGDPMIRERLRREIPQREAVLAWLIAGAIKYYGSYESFALLPERVSADTLEWRKNSDLVLGYITERIDFDPDSDILSTELLEDFNNWLSTGNQRAWSAKTFVSRFGGHEEVSSRGVRNGVSKNRDALSRRSPYGGFAPPIGASTFRVWHGIAFRQPDGEAADDIRRYQEELRQAQEWNDAVGAKAWP
jgi:P4 family phage/plasmid primase-like protien